VCCPQCGTINHLCAKVADLVKQLRSGVPNNRLIETLGGMQHYVSCLKAADRIEADAKRIAELEEILNSYPGTGTSIAAAADMHPYAIIEFEEKWRKWRND
jgi:hypothetical protein